MKIRIDQFVLAIIAAIVLAWLFPEWGNQSNIIPFDLISTIGISLIFFFYGLKLSPKNIKSGLANWKLHFLIQGSTFVLFPLLIIPFFFLVKASSDYTIWVGFLFLAALPSTVSSSVVMVSMAKGNIPAAIFNASISGLIGIVVTPLWMELFLKHSSYNVGLSTIYMKLLTEILLPVLFGLILQKYWGKFALRHNRWLSLFDKIIILIIIFKSFAESFQNKVFNSVSLVDLLWISAIVIGLFFFVFVLIGFVSKCLHFSTEDQITAQYCGTKKSLVHGTVFSKVLFPASMPVGIILLPLMLFHAFQIFLISILASQQAKRKSLM